MAYRIWSGNQKTSGQKHREIGYYSIDVYNILRPNGWTGLLPSTRGQHFCDCRCHTCYDWNKDPSISSNTGSSSRSTSSSISSRMGLQITHLQGLSTLTRLPSPHMQIGTLMTLYQTIGPQMSSELMSFIIENIFESWTRVQIASSFTMTPGLIIPTRFRSHLPTQKKLMESAVQLIINSDHSW